LNHTLTLDQSAHLKAFMKKDIYLALLVSFGFIALLWFEKPLRTFLIQNEVAELNAKFISGIFIRSVLLLFSVLLIKKLNLLNFTGLVTRRVFNLQAVFIPLVFISVGIMSNSNTVLSSSNTILALFTLSVILVGLIEEFVFRGIVLPQFIKFFKNKKNVLLISAVISSFIFGTIHFINLFSQPNNLGGITSQVFFALSIGVFFSGLMLRTQNIFIPALIHGLVNFSFGSGELKPNITKSTSIIGEAGIDWSSIIPTSIFFLFIFAGGVFMINKSDKNYFLAQLGLDQPASNNLI